MTPNDIILPSAKPTVDQRALQKEIRAAAKGTSWRQRDGVCFQQVDHWFIAGHVRSYKKNEEIGLYSELMAKPMAIDPLLWRIMDMTHEKDPPLSFRYFGWCRCGCPVVGQTRLTEATAADTAAAHLVALDDMLPSALQKLQQETFSDIAQNSLSIHDNWCMSETVLFSLILERKHKTAVEFAKSFVQTGKGGLYMSAAHWDAAKAGKSFAEIFLSDAFGKNETIAATTYNKKLSQVAWLRRLFSRDCR